MRDIKSDEARRDWRDLLDEVQSDRGAAIRIMRYDKPVAVLVPAVIRDDTSPDPRTWSDARLARMHAEHMGDFTIDAAFSDRFPLYHGFRNAAQWLAKQHIEAWQQENDCADPLALDSGYEPSAEAEVLMTAYRRSVDKLAADLDEHDHEGESDR